jgi:hypothetical protein
VGGFGLRAGVPRAPGVRIRAASLAIRRAAASAKQILLAAGPSVRIRGRVGSRILRLAAGGLRLTVSAKSRVRLTIVAGPPQ